MGTLLRTVGRLATGIERGMSGISALTIFLIMVLVVADVAMRYAFNNPIKWSYPVISRYLMLYVFFFAVADTLRRNQHVIVGFLVGAMGIRGRSLVELVAYLPSILIFALVLGLGIGLVWSQFVHNDVVMDSLGWPSWIATLALPIGIGMLLVRIVLRVTALAARAVDPAADVAAAYGDPAEGDARIEGHE
ncbi:MAG: TRAP transporter small permease [Betaproteobacteria bacterium]